jgi:hypothetical protein
MSADVVGEQSGASFVPVVWLIDAKNAAELDSVSQANGNETLVLCPAIDGIFDHEYRWIWRHHVFFFTGKVK